jgi:hypothetical protein
VVSDMQNGSVRRAKLKHHAAEAGGVEEQLLVYFSCPSGG